MKTDLPRLWQAMQDSLREMEKFQTNFYEHVRAFLGSNYSDTDPKYQAPVNLIAQYINIIPRQLVGADPRFMASTFDRDLRALTSAFETWGNKKLQKMKFTDTLRRAVIDSVFLIGITKTSITAPSEMRLGGYTKKAGEPGMWNINYQDFVFDSKSDKFDECDYVGHSYMVPTDDIRNSKLYSKKPRLKVVADTDQPNDQRGNARLSTLSRGSISNQDEYTERSRIWEIYRPREGIVVTFWEGETEEPLLEQKWIGPECGPFDYLALGEYPPGNIMPKSPIMDLIDLHREHNVLWKKTGNQAENQKTVIMYRNSEDATSLQKAKDGDYMRTQDPEGVKESSTGGPNNLVSLRVVEARKVFNDQAGNIEALGGLGPQSETATQDKMILGSASKQVEGMADRVITFAQKLMRNIGWYWWNDPFNTMRTTFSVPGLPDLTMNRLVTPQQRMQFNFDDMDVMIDPYSLLYQTPQQRVGTMDKMMKEIVIPLLPLWHQPGISDFLQEYVKKLSKYTNNPDLIELMEKLIGVQGMWQAPGQEQTVAPQDTQHTYERISRPGTTDRGQEQIMQQLLGSGQTNQGAGMEALMGEAG